MKLKDPKLIALQFNEYINNQDIKGLSNLKTEDHIFIDRANDSYKELSKDSLEKDYVIWKARIENDLVSEWCIYEDIEDNRKKFGLYLVSKEN